MSNPSDKDIDRLSRDAAEFYEPDNSMLSWKKLEQNLIEQIPERPPDIRSLFRTRPLIWAPAVLLLTGITYYLIKNAAHSKISTLKNQTELSSRDQSAPEEKVSSQINRQAAPEDDANTSSEKTSALNAEKGNEYLSNALAGNKSVKASADKLPAAHDADGRNLPGSEASAAFQRNAHLNGTAGKKTFSEAAVSQEENQETEFSSIAAASKQNPAGQRTHAVRLPAPAAFIGHPVVSGNDSSLNRFAVSVKNAKKNSKSLQINRSLTVGLVMGPDYSDVGGMSNDQLGNNLGISLGYYLSSRLSVNTGFQFTIKNYWTEGKFFQPQSGVNSAYAFPRIESVNGSCNMYEIPLTLRYDFFQHERTRLFVNAGLSSYLMRKEEYTFFFHNAGRAYEWQNENNERRNYWFAIGDFSAGLEQELGKGFSFQVEPFLRMPLRGIGAGNLKMNSYGLLFSMRYAPVLGRSRK
ncbi:MAG: hypothetical protein Q8918_15515 [Bacteroidota bacterium]|nr:hypothetical protein [Bacteroidota bacterium]